MTTDKIIPFPAPVLKESEHSSFTEQVAKRFRLVPNFFVSAPDAPEVIERLWAFAAAAYLDNPIPTLFKERLFVFLSRFCPVRYCIVRHCGFLVGYGDAAGDPAHHTQTIEQVIELLQTSPPWRRDLEPIYSSLAAVKKPVDWPAPGSEIEDQLFAVCTLIFVNPTQSERALNALRQAVGGKRFEYVLALLAFIRTAHFWTLVHPGIAMGDDVKELLKGHKELAALLLQEPEPLPA
ncbi:MAG: hypothetical protein WCB50_21040 [Pseudolabrys sp.]